MTPTVAEVAADLIRMDTSNRGDNLGVGEIEAAEYVARFLLDLGLSPRILGPDSRRASVVCQIEGERPELPGLLLHGHLDVVPADPDEWDYHPFKGEIVDGVLWGRGAVDMKGQDAIILVSVADLITTGKRPNRNLTLLFTADEEAGGVYGARWLVEHHPEIFTGVGYAIGEVGGFNLTLPNGKKMFFVQVGEKGMFWAKLKATGTPGHGSLLNSDNAVAKLGAAITRLAAHDFGRSSTPTSEATLTTLADHLGNDLPSQGEPASPLSESMSPSDTDEILGQIGSMGRVIGASLQNTCTPTVLRAGEKVNVVPAHAEVEIDGRFLPGDSKRFESVLQEVVGPEIDIEIMHTDIAYESPLDDPILQAMSAALRSEIPGAVVVPYLMPGGTDAKHFSPLGVTCYGFLPMLLPQGFDAMSLFHAANERVPVSSLEFGVRTLSRFLVSES